MVNFDRQHHTIKNQLGNKTVGISVKDYLGVSGHSHSMDQFHRENIKGKH